MREGGKDHRRNRQREKGGNSLSLKAGMDPEQLRRLVSLSFSFIFVPKTGFLTINSEFRLEKKTIINSLKMSCIHTAWINFYHLLLCLPPVMKASGPTKCTDILPHSVVFPPIEMLSYMFTSLDLFSNAAPLTLSRADARTVLKTERKRYIAHVQ